MAISPSRPLYFVTYLTADQVTLWQDEEAPIPPAVGQGIVSEDGRRWRVRDVWVIGEKHGGLEYGTYAFVEPAVGEDDLLATVDPQYYGPSQPTDQP